MINIGKLLEDTKRLILLSNGRISYLDISAVMNDMLEPEKQASLLLAMSAICYHIPLYKNGQRLVRELDKCLTSAITFYNSNKEEAEIVQKSNSFAKIADDLTGYYVLPALSFGDTTHGYLESGTGNCTPDLVDSDGVTYEVKRRYRNGSPSSLHKADYLIDCLNTTIEVRKVEKDGKVNLEYPPEARFNGFLSEKLTEPKTRLDEETMHLLYEGTLIPQLDLLLANSDFRWNL